MATSVRNSQTFNLSDGRVLGFAEYGKPDGNPLLYFHGYPSSRLEASVTDQIGRRLGVRILALDRPGFGLSTPQPDRRILDWPTDVQEFAKGQNLSEFAVLGLSGGGPFALACGHLLPRSMVTGVGLFASGPPWVADPSQMSYMHRVTRLAANTWPSGLRVFLNATVGLVKWILETRMISRWIDRWLHEQDRKKEEANSAGNDDAPSAAPLRRPTSERRQDLVRLVIGEPFVQGAEAAVHEARLLSSDDWGFQFEDVQYDPIWIWHGAQDANAPVGMIRYLAERLPHSKLRVFEGDTHYTMFKHFEGAVSDLLNIAGREEPSSNTSIATAE
ncbi:hypothetical protein LTR84_009077 [Exophiala bonariae]|uniref:AB hydrolase-1 domain-containing protein n=1 Tax=Exophiala bonariae TaxID=1690606 RepID=A0AAV9MY97_9EURO|nr:hypothetical protein LTR84_009077 [Exophiala bonariae]